MNNNGFFRVVAAVPEVKVSDVPYNVGSIKRIATDISDKGAQLIVFPELCVTGYTCADLFHQELLLDEALLGLEDLRKYSVGLPAMIVVGAPLRQHNTLYNCAVAIADGKIVAVIPKTYLPNYNEFYEKRWFSAADSNLGGIISLPSGEATFGTEQLINLNGVKIGVEICEDLWSPIPPSSYQSLAGADIIVNLSASDDLIGKYSYLKSLIAQQSARCISGYVYASAGFGESTTDLAFDGKAIIAENGTILSANSRWSRHESYTISDIDIMALRRDRMHIKTFSDCANRELTHGYFETEMNLKETLPVSSSLLRDIPTHPFVPAEGKLIDERCEEIVNIQISGLAQRLNATHTKSLVIGISGGLDSTLALLVATRTFDALGLDRSGILGVTMPGFGTTDRTHDNAVSLMQTLGVSSREISIVPAVNQHFKDIGHDSSVKDVTYENSQARERTQLLMDIANQTGGMVLGTGDLSELALGWATYNGDHMSMYGVNSGVPKTLVKYLVRWFASRTDNEEERSTLHDIIDTPISPELIPAAADGTIQQKTEDLVGPYELHDFFLYYTLRYGFTPKRIFLLAKNAFGEAYQEEKIKYWLKTFFRRFFNQQFKRSCLPDGPKVGSVCLSPRGDWRMPSDASSAIWLKECEKL